MGESITQTHTPQRRQDKQALTTLSPESESASSAMLSWSTSRVVAFTRGEERLARAIALSATFCVDAVALLDGRFAPAERRCMLQGRQPPAPFRRRGCTPFSPPAHDHGEGTATHSPCSHHARLQHAQCCLFGSKSGANTRRENRRSGGCTDPVWASVLAGFKVLRCLIVITRQPC